MNDDVEGKITQSELIELFGETMPMEAVKVIFEAPDAWTVGMVREEIRRIARAGGTVHAGDLDVGIPNHLDHTKRGFTPK